MVDVDSVAMAFVRFPQIHLNLQSPWTKNPHSKNLLFPGVGGGAVLKCHAPMLSTIRYPNSLNFKTFDYLIIS